MSGNFIGGDKDKDVKEMIPHIIPVHIQVVLLCQYRLYCCVSTGD